ncbi:MAG TPA: hypothetical protein VL284_17810 [Thermoanaerobaculia bacterium]|nr:hypothetical protein [Thermoanaerobaculia bacterium]
MSRVRAVSVLLGLAAAARAISLTWLHPLNWDEVEFFRACEWVSRGLVPYRDFFEHHTPLQWFVFAPVAARIRAPGAIAIVAMRWAQVPLWIAVFCLLSLWMRQIGISLFARLMVIAIALCSSMFMLAAVEFRVDVLACALFFLALVLAQRGSMIGCGSALVLSGVANIRFGPLLVVALVAFAVQRRDRIGRLLAGVAAALAVCGAYFTITHSISIAWQRLIVDNYLADHWATRAHAIFLHRLLTPFGVTLNGFVPSAIDAATIVIFVTGVIGMVRRDSRLNVLAILQIANVAFIAVMKFIQIYHFEIVILLMLPFVAIEIERWRRERAMVAILAVLVAINIAVSLFRGKEGDLQYQDLIMREADRRTPPDGTVFAGVGWALHRKPAYRYWFLREIVRVMEAHGRYEPYRPNPADPPAAFISDYGARVWLASHPELRRYFTTHYLPVWRDLWLPGMSGIVPARGRAVWIVPATGDYRLYMSEDLAKHPWFRGDPTATTLLQNGMPIRLRRGSLYGVTSSSPRPVGVFIVPASTTKLFRYPLGNVDIDGAPPPQWHVPHLW